MLHQLFPADLQAEGNYPELKKKKITKKKHSSVTWQNFVATKIELWVYMHLSTDNTLHDSDRAMEKCSILLYTEK